MLMELSDSLDPTKAWNHPRIYKYWKDSERVKFTFYTEMDSEIHKTYELKCENQRWLDPNIWLLNKIL